MKRFFYSVGALLLAVLPSALAGGAVSATTGTAKATATSTGGATTTASTAGTPSKATPPVTVAPGEQKTAYGVTVTNGNFGGDHPQYAGSTGKVKIKVQDGATEVKTDGDVKCEIKDLSTGEKVIIGTNCNPVDVKGTGGTVAVGSGSTVCITNQGATGGANITVTLPGGSSVTITPGNSATVTG
jgi:hypothetical protein